MYPAWLKDELWDALAAENAPETFKTRQ